MGGIQFPVSFSCVGELWHFGEKRVEKAKHDSSKNKNKTKKKHTYIRGITAKNYMQRVFIGSEIFV